MTRAEVKALPIRELAASHGAYGSLTVLAFKVETLKTIRLYALLPDLRRHYRVVQDDPIKAHITEKHLRAVWTRLVDHSIGYWLCGVQRMQVYADA